MEKRERYRGCLIGLAVGDAWGTTLELQRPGSFTLITAMLGGCDGMTINKERFPTYKSLPPCSKNSDHLFTNLPSMILRQRSLAYDRGKLKVLSTK